MYVTSFCFSIQLLLRRTLVRSVILLINEGKARLLNEERRIPKVFPT